MKNTFGSSIAVTLFGESHGEAIGAVIDGIAPGVKVDPEFIKEKLSLRKPFGDISTKRHEDDEPEILSGVMDGRATGTPICIIIRNMNKDSSSYDKIAGKLRPGHADYTAHMKYHGFEDARGGGHFSGRLTAALVAAGAVAMSALAEKGIQIGSHIASIGGIEDAGIGCSEEDIKRNIEKLSKERFAVIDEGKAELMQQAVKKAAEEGDSLGGILETAVTGLPAGLGEPWFDTLEGVISHAIFSIPAIKGIEFGAGFGFASMKGSDANDAFRVKDGRVVTSSNNNGGINGGISNGMPIVLRCAVKPTPSIFKEQDSVDVASGEEIRLKISGRHDPAIIHRARAVVDAVTALVLSDQLALRYGTDWLGPNESK